MRGAGTVDNETGPFDADKYEINERELILASKSTLEYIKLNFPNQNMTFSFLKPM